MSVGEASYFYVPDDDLSDLCSYCDANIIPEITKKVTTTKIVFNSGRTCNCPIRNGCIVLDNLTVENGESSFTLDDGRCFVLDDSQVRDISEDDPLFVEFQVRRVESDSLKLAAKINTALSIEGEQSTEAEACCRMELVALEAKCGSLMSIVKSRTSTAAEEQLSCTNQLDARLNKLLAAPTKYSGGTASTAVASIVGVNKVDRRSLHDVLLALRCSAAETTAPATRAAVRKQPSGMEERLNAVLSVLQLCQSGLRVLSVGGRLSTDIGTIL
jgi:hypothetical protein